MHCLPVSARFFQIPNRFPCTRGEFDFAPGATPNVAPDVDDEDFVRHFDLALMHVVQHLLCPFAPHLVIAGVPKESYANDNISLKGQTLLCFNELVLETRAAAESYDFVWALHLNMTKQ